MAIDNEKKASDQVFDIAGFEYLADKEFMAKVTPIKIDFNGFGFQISSNLPQGGGACGGCGTSSECCS